ncbi:nitroreductase family protein [Paenibacillus filicis]|uniref:Nitroreductase family protein n=1 Tax=Paenibacillus filicis TaxID=669464 RepID=A0ABU9DQT2_9BACL
MAEEQTIVGATAEKREDAVTADFLNLVRERSSIRHYDPNFKIEESEIREILEAAALAPSSSNLQPWRFLVIQDQAAKQELFPIAFSQQQVLDASAVIAVLADKLAYKNADRIYSGLVKLGAMNEDVKTKYVAGIHQNYGNLSETRSLKIAATDGGLVSMQLMLAAKAKGYDTVPMGGYDADKFVEAFGVPENYVPVMLIAIGKGVKASYPKTRLPLDEILTWNKY